MRKGIALLLLVICAAWIGPRDVHAQPARAAVQAPTVVDTPEPTLSPTPSPTPSPSPTPTPLPTPVGGGSGANNGCPPGQFGIAFWPAPLCFNPGDMVGAFIEGFGQLVMGGLGTITAPFVNMLILTPDMANDPTYSDLQSFFLFMRQIGAALLVLCTVLGAIQSLLRASGRPSVHLAIAPVGRLVVGVGLLLFLPQAMSWWFTGVNALAQAINSFTGHLATDLVSKLLEMAFGLVLGVPALTLLYAIFGVAAAVLICLIGIVRMVGDMLLATLYVTGPLTIALWVFPATAHIARAWFNGLLAVSSWGPAYAIVLKVITVVVVALPSSPGLIGFDLLEPLMGIAGLVILYRVPRIVGGLVGSMVGDHAGVTGPADVVVGAGESRVSAQVLSYLP